MDGSLDISALARFVWIQQDLVCLRSQIDANMTGLVSATCMKQKIITILYLAAAK